MRRICIIALASGCSGDDGTTKDVYTTDTLPTVTAPVNDADRDGFSIAEGDCDDEDATVYPGADDPAYDGVDSDCAGDSDFDADGDGQDSLEHGGTDCDDANPAVFVDAEELCNGRDDDCDESIDGPDATDAMVFYDDADGDGHGTLDSVVFGCTAPTGAVASNDDCDDGQASVYPGAPEVPCDGFDNDCNELTLGTGVATLDGVPMADLDAALAAATAGATIELCEGVYPGTDHTIGTGLSILTFADSASTVLDGGDAGSVLRITTSTLVILEGLTLTGGRGTAGPIETMGGGLFAAPGSTVLATDVVVTGNRAGAGGGLWLGSGTTLELHDCHIDANTADDTLAIVSTGGGLWADSSSSISAFDTTIDGNTAMECGGVWLGANGTLDGDGTSTVSFNTTSGLAGGGICARGGGTLRGLDVASNESANIAGGIDATDVLIDSLTIRQNEAGLDAGGLWLSGIVDMFSTTIDANIANIDGGGLSATFDDTEILLQDCDVVGNEALFFAALGGGAQLVQGARLTAVNTDWGGALGGVDNTPSDVELSTSGLSFSWPGVADFVCDDVLDTCL